MGQKGDVRSESGVPIVADFGNSTGTPLYINLDTGHTYYLDSTGAVQPIALVARDESGYGITVDPDNPAYPWRDLEGALIPKSSGAGSPPLATFQGNLRWYNYNAGDDMDALFHIPHDYAPGSDLHFHLHWSHNGTNISGTSVINYYMSYAKGHSQATFPAQITITQTLTGLNLTNTPQYTHRIDEFVITSDGGSATTFDNGIIEPDGLLHVHFDWATIPTITGGSGRPFGFYLDLHYQSTNIGTLNKAPGFYGT